MVCDAQFLCLCADSRFQPAGADEHQHRPGLQLQKGSKDLQQTLVVLADVKAPHMAKHHPIVQPITRPHFRADGGENRSFRLNGVGNDVRRSQSALPK